MNKTHVTTNLGTVICAKCYDIWKGDVELGTKYLGQVFEDDSSKWMARPIDDLARGPFATRRKAIMFLQGIIQ